MIRTRSRNTTARWPVESVQDVAVDLGRAVLTLAGIVPGDHWVDGDGAVHVVTWVRKIGVVGYRSAAAAAAAAAAEHTGVDQVMDVVRFVRTFTPLSDSTTTRAA
jgi:hypothetical protein